MNRHKDQILLENLYDQMAQRQITTDQPVTPEEKSSDYVEAENKLLRALDMMGITFDQDGERFQEAVQSIVATMQHSPEDVDTTVEQAAFGLDQPEQQEQQEPEVMAGVGYEDEEQSSPFEARYESILNAYEKVLAEAGKVNPYAVCTKTVGRKDEAKYKRCKKKVTSGAKKSGKNVTSEPVK